jgi:hypothetical protein
MTAAIRDVSRLDPRMGARPPAGGWQTLTPWLGSTNLFVMDFAAAERRNLAGPGKETRLGSFRAWAGAGMGKAELRPTKPKTLI